MLADLNHVAEEESWCRRSQVEAQPGKIIEQVSPFHSQYLLGQYLSKRMTSMCLKSETQYEESQSLRRSLASGGSGSSFQQGS